jgi:hypothetical protein
MASTIKLKNGSGAPTTGDLVQGEPALDLTNKRLYTENASGVVIEVGTNPSTIDINAGTIDGTVIGGTTAAAITGTTITGTSFVSSGDMTFEDNDKAVFGDGSDLRIYHTGSHSTIENIGTGHLQIHTTDFRLRNSAGTESMILANADGNVQLFYDNAEKLATTATGIDVTGTVTADGLSLDNAQYINFKNSSNVSTRSLGINVANTFYIGGIDADIGDILFVDGGATRASFANGGDISFYEDTGTTAKFFWDASAERLGIGNSAPTQTLEVTGGIRATVTPSNTVQASLLLANAATTSAANLQLNTSGGLSVWSYESGGAGWFNSATIASSGNVGIGTSSPTGAKLQVVAESGSNVLGVGTTTQGLFIKTTGTTVDYNSSGNSGGEHTFSTGNIERMRIDVSGNVGIGTSSPSRKVSLVDSVNGYNLELQQTSAYNSGNQSGIVFSAPYNIGGSVTDLASIRGGKENATDEDFGGKLAFYTRANGGSDTERMRIDSSGNLGLGVVPSAWRSGAKAFQSGGNGLVTLWEQANGSTNLGFGVYESASNVFNYTTTGDTPTLYSQLTGVHKWFNAPSGTAGNAISFTQAMTLDSSGNLLVGHTSLNGTGGVDIGTSGYVRASRSGDEAAIFNRETNDGTIAVFSKDGTTVGSIGAYAGHLSLGNTDTGLLFNDTIKSIYAFNVSTLANNDNAIDLGWASVRFDDIYATNGTIQTSDRNEKQDIEVLSEAEQRVAVAAKGLLRKFRWKDSVEEKGDDARIHFGIIAQDLQAAFEAEGLDAGRYAMFIHSTWTDEETGEERSRMGVRYSELLAFIIAAI